MLKVVANPMVLQELKHTIAKKGCHDLIMSGLIVVNLLVVMSHDGGKGSVHGGSHRGDPFGGQVDGGDCSTHRDHPHTRPIGRQVSSYQSQLDPSCPLVLATLVLQAPRLTSDQPPIINSYTSQPAGVLSPIFGLKMTRSQMLQRIGCNLPAK